MKIPLTKFISQSGYCSRRKAEELIRNGSVFVNDKKAILGQVVDGKDVVKIGKNIIKIKNEKIYIKLNKPIDYVCSNKRFPGERSIFELVRIKEKLFVVGRLDKDSHGLVILTNDGDWAQTIMHPKYEHEKKYIVETHCNASLPILKIINNFLKGIDIGDGDGIAKAKKIKYIGNGKFEIVLTEGKKRQIRRMFRTQDCEVVDLQRVSIGKINLGNLPKGKWEKITI